LAINDCLANNACSIALWEINELCTLHITIICYIFVDIHVDAPPSSFMDSTTSPNVKIVEGEGVGACSLACNTSGVEGVLELWDGTRKIDK
jgi:hypothetical protein